MDAKEVSITAVHVLRHEYDLYVGRQSPRHGLIRSPFANPFPLPDGATLSDRADCLRRYRAHVLSDPELVAALHRGELRGLRLACWCYREPSGPEPPPVPFCHVDVLRELQAELLLEEPEAMNNPTGAAPPSSLFGEDEVPVIAQEKPARRTGKGGEPDPLTTAGTGAAGSPAPAQEKPKKEKAAPVVDPAAVPDPTPEEAALLAKVKDTPPPDVLRERYPERTGRVAVTVPIQPGVTCAGRLMGHIYPSGAFLKIIDEKHVLTNPPAIAYDAQACINHKPNIKAFCVFIKSRRQWYTVSATVFFDKKVVMNRGKGGVQYALPLAYWNCHECGPAAK